MHQLTISYYCHILYAFLLSKQSETPCTVQLLMTLMNKNDSLIPLEIDFICKLLQTLSDRGIILFLDNQQQNEKSWIVLNTKIIMEDINGVLSTQNKFKYCPVASSTGNILSSALAMVFPNYDQDMLVSFLENFEMCHCVNLSGITTNLQDNEALPYTSVNDRLLFFPSLLDIKRPIMKLSKQAFSFGCMVSQGKEPAGTSLFH